jgi:hypothetical protein
MEDCSVAVFDRRVAAAMDVGKIPAIESGLIYDVISWK